jgi:putative membrane protein
MMLIVKWLLSAVALLFIAYIYKGVSVAGFGSALIAALVIGLLNLLVRPILIVLTIPITLVTLGLFLFVINALMFWAASGILSGYHGNGICAAKIGTLLYSLLGVLIDRALTGGAGARWV